MKTNSTTFLILAAAAVGAVVYFSNSRNLNPYKLPADIMASLKSAVPGAPFSMLSSDGKTYSGTVTDNHYIQSLQVV